MYLDCIPNCIFEDQNKVLTSILSYEEISKVFFSFDGDKAPGLDGFPFLFFHKYWGIISVDVCNEVKAFFGSRKLLKELNGTFLSLITKKSGAGSMDQF